MDLGCLDLGCTSVSDKHSTVTILDPPNKETDASENVTSATKTGKSKSPKGNGQSTLSALYKFTSQIKKPPHRKNSPINWFPRKKVDSYLKRKIKMLQEIDGKNLSLDETLGDSNPHYSRVLREKIAAKEAAHAAMEARKSALVEASWRKILQAARIQSKEAEELLVNAEKAAAEAFEAATTLGVIMYDEPNRPQKPSEIKTSTVNGGRSTTHTVTASFETAFEVDKEVAAAVKTAFIRLVSCPSFNKDEFKELLCKINQNPNMGNNDNDQESSEFSSEYESESGSEVETISQNDGINAQDKCFKLSTMDTRQRKYKRRQSLEKLSMTKLVDMMLERLRCLKEDELSSLATIVATCGLNAALAEAENRNIPRRMSTAGSATDYSSNYNVSRRMSTAGAGTMTYSSLEQMRRKQVVSELPSLDKFLVKHMSKLEREVQEAKNSKRNIEGNVENIDQNNDASVNLDTNSTSCETVPDLDIILVKHSCQFVKEIEEAKKNSGKNFDIANRKSVSDPSEAIPDLGSILIMNSSKLEKEVQELRKNSQKAPNIDGKEFERASNGVISHRRKEHVSEVPSLDKFLVKHVSRLEKEIQESKNRWMINEKKSATSSASVSEPEKIPSSADEEATAEKENIDKNLNSGLEKIHEEVMKAGNKEKEDGLEPILVKPVHRLEKEKMQALSLKSSHRNRRKHGGNTPAEYEGLDKVLVKHVSRLERARMEFSLKEEEEVKKKISGRNKNMQKNEEGSLDQILVKHKSRLESEKMASSEQAGEEIKLSVSRREARERELQEAWGGLSLGNSIKPHISKIERDKAAWIKAEEEERRRAIGQV